MGLFFAADVEVFRLTVHCVPRTIASGFSRSRQSWRNRNTKQLGRKRKLRVKMNLLMTTHTTHALICPIQTETL